MILGSFFFTSRVFRVSDGKVKWCKMKLEEVPSTAQPFITVANHNYDQKATPERTFSFAAFYQFRQKHYERSIIQAYSLEVFFSLFLR